MNYKYISVNIFYRIVNILRNIMYIYFTYIFNSKSNYQKILKILKWYYSCNTFMKEYLDNNLERRKNLRPIIGITCAWSIETWEDSSDGGYYYVGKPYVEAVYKYGGIPLLITPQHKEADIETLIDEILDNVDGLLFSGGGDARRFLSDELPTLEAQQPRRYYFEKNLMLQAWKRKMPVLGICRGHQMIAEVFEGSISKNTVEGHKQNIPGYEPWHEITIDKESKIYDIISKDKWNVNSFHKQVIGDIPKGFKVTMMAENNIIEGIEALDNIFFLGVQFHPEELEQIDKTAGKIFIRFIKDAVRYANS